MTKTNNSSRSERHDKALFRLAKTSPLETTQLLDLWAQQDARPAALTPEHQETVRVVPNEFLRCKLFRVAHHSEPRAYLKEALLPVQAARGGSITYTGEELRQDDRAVLLECLYYERASRGYALVKPRAMCRALGWSDSNVSIERLRECLLRLKASAVVLRSPRLEKSIAVSLIKRLEEQADGTLKVLFDEEIRDLFAGNHYTRIVAQFQKLLGSRASLAQWLLAFYASHREPMPMSAEALRTMCGATSEAREFRRMLKEAHARLVEVGFLSSYTLSGDKVAVSRQSSHTAAL